MARDTKRAFSRLIASLEPQIQQAFLAAIEDVTSAAQMAIIEGAIDRGDLEAVIQALHLRPEFFAPLDDALRRAYIMGGADLLQALPKLQDPAGNGRLVIRFRGRHPRAERWINNHSSSLVTGILDDQRQSIRQSLRANLELGRNPRQTALELVGRIDRAKGRRVGGLIGLTSDQATWVRNLRAELADPDQMARYFTRTKRDRRYDGLVRRHLSEGRPLAQADIDRIAGRYADRLLKLRGDTVARTETIASLNAGRNEGLEQLIDTGAVNRDQVKIAWNATGDGRTRDSHAAMHGQTVKFGEAFTSPTGARMLHPRDTSLGAGGADVIGCRCYAQVKIDHLAGLRRNAA